MFSHSLPKNLKMMGKIWMDNNGICTQESRITHLEAISQKRDEEITMLNKSLKELNSQMLAMSTSMVHLESTIASFKWWVTVWVALFGAVFTFLVVELIKMI